MPPSAPKPRGPYNAPPPRRVLPINGLAITSAILGIASLPGSLLYGVPGILLGLTGIGFYIAAAVQLRHRRHRPNSHGWAVAGLVCSITGLCLGVCILLLAIAVFKMTKG